MIRIFLPIFQVRAKTRSLSIQVMSSSAERKGRQSEETCIQRPVGPSEDVGHAMGHATLVLRHRAASVEGL